MVLKELPMPQRLLLTLILQPRLRPGHPKHSAIEKDLGKRWAGYWGEMALANYVKELPHDQYYIFHDLQLEFKGIHFQIDTLLLTRSYILIIEAKNIAGTLYFDNVFKQLLRKNADGTEESFEDPRVQCQRLQSLFRNWMIKNGLNLLPIDTLIFFKSTSTILKANPGDKIDFSRVCKGRDVFNKIEAIEQRYTQERIDQQTLNKVVNMLLCGHSPQPIQIVEEYNLTEKDILRGVRCPECSRIAMNYKKGKWICPACGSSSKTAHIDSLTDYFYLIKPLITNAELRRFLHLPTNNIAQKLLFSLSLPYTGSTKNRIYHLAAKEGIHAVYFKKAAAGSC